MRIYDGKENPPPQKTKIDLLLAPTQNKILFIIGTIALIAAAASYLN